MSFQDDSAIKELYKISDEINFSECMGCNEPCCRLPELLKCEYDFLASKFNEEKFKKISSTHFIQGSHQCIFYNDKHGCEIYKYRPLVCRIFPIDLLEDNGEYWWCIYTTCSKYRSLQKKLMPLIPRLEALITKDIFDQYVDQDNVAKNAYEPYRLKKYIKISRHMPSF